MSENKIKYCPECGKMMLYNAKFCSNCGFNFDFSASHATQNANKSKAVVFSQHTISRKSRTVLCLLCLFLGFFGAHRFYAGKSETAILYLFTGGLFFIGYLVDLIYCLSGTFKDVYEDYIEIW